MTRFLGSIPMNGVACAVGDVLVSLAYVDEGESLSHRMFSKEMIIKFTFLSVLGLLPVLLKHIFAPMATTATGTTTATTSKPTSSIHWSIKKHLNKVYSHLLPASLINTDASTKNTDCTIS